MSNFIDRMSCQAGDFVFREKDPANSAFIVRSGGVVSRGTFEENLKKTDPFIRTLLKIFVETIRRQQNA